MTRHLLSFGHGYSAQALARLLLPEGFRITGTTRDAGQIGKLNATGITAVPWPGTDMEPLIGEATHVLVSIGPRDGSDPVLDAYEDAFRANAGRLQWVGYLSTTGVYGDHGGDWVDETSPTRPGTLRGKRRLEAERRWLAIPGLPVHVFRLAGIYGPGRGPFAKIRAGTARRIIKPGQIFSRIHVDDIARVLAASIARPNPGAIYNVCDDDPAPPQDVLAHAAELLGAPVPPEVPWDSAELTPMARSFYSENKRVRNDRIKRELGVELLYPDYRSGLAAILAAETAAEEGGVPG